MAKKQAASAKKAQSAPRKSKLLKADNFEAAKSGISGNDKRAANLAAPAQRGLSSEMVGATAGEVWRVLADRGPQTLAAIKKSLDAPDDQVLLALGWLAREDKLAFETNGRTITVLLT